MSDKPKDRTGEKEKPGSNYAGVVTRGTWAKMQKEGEPDLDPVEEDEDRGRGLQLTSCVSDLIKGESQAHGISQEAVDDETDGGESPPDRKSFSAEDLLQLNEYVVLYLFQFMKPGDILKASQTCWLWREWGENEKVWELKCKEAGLAYSLTPADQRALERRNEKSTITYSAWKVNFLKPYKIAKNFREGDPQMLTIEINNAVSHLEFTNDKIVTLSGSPPTYIHVFCAQSGSLLHELVGHTMQVTAIQMDQEFVVSSSRYGSMKIWDVETGACLHKFIDDHTQGIYCLKMHGHIVVSGSRDDTVRMWDVREGRHLRTLTGHTGSVCYVQFDGKFVVSGSSDDTIKIWDAVTGECVHTLRLNPFIMFIMSLEFNGVDVVAVCMDGSFMVWDVETGVLRYTLEGHNDGGYMEVEGNVIVCRGDDATTAEIWDISAGVRLHTLAGPHKHNDVIRGIQVSEKFMLTSTEDEIVKLWDVKSGEFIRDLVLGSGLGEEKTVDRQQFGIGYPTIIRVKNAKIVGAVSSSTRSQLLVLNFDSNDDENFSLEEKLSYWKGLTDFEKMRLIVAGLYCDFLPEGNPWDSDDDSPFICTGCREEGPSDTAALSTLATPKQEGRPKKQSLASKSNKFQRLLRFQERLVTEKGLPRSRLQCQLDITPNLVKHCPEKTSKCTRNLLTHFQDTETSSCLGQSSAPSAGRTSGTNIQGIEASPCLYGAPAPFTATHSNISRAATPSTGPSVTTIGQTPVNRVDTLEAHVSPGQEVEGELESVKKNGEYSEVISCGQEKIFTRSYSRYETDQKDTFHSDVPSTSSQMFYPPMSEAWISGYNVGLGVAAQVYCWGCGSFGFIVPSTALGH